MSLLEELMMDEDPALESFDDFNFDFDFDIAEEGLRDIPGAVYGKAKDGVNFVGGKAKAGFNAVKGGAADKYDDAKTGFHKAKNAAGDAIDTVKGAPGAIKDKLSARKSVEANLLKQEKHLRALAARKDGLAKIEQYEAAVQKESAKIADAVRELSKLGKAVQDGSMSKEDAVRRAKPVTKELANLCSIMKFGIVIGDKLSVTQEDLKTLSAYTKGLQGLISKYKAEAKGAETEDAASESFFTLDDLFAAVEADIEVEDEFKFAFESFGDEGFDLDSFLDAEFSF